MDRAAHFEFGADGDAEHGRPPGATAGSSGRAAEVDPTELPVLTRIVAQHVAEAAYLHEIRVTVRGGAAVRLADLERLDERIAAHLDGIEIAAGAGVAGVRRALEHAGPGTLFVAAVRAIDDGNRRGLDEAIAIADALPVARPGVVAAFGWATPARLRGIVGDLLRSALPWPRELGLAACALHGANPGPALRAAFESTDPVLRAFAARVAGVGGRVECLGTCGSLLDDAAPACRREAAIALALLGERGRAEGALVAALEADRQAFDVRALDLLTKLQDGEGARALLGWIWGRGPEGHRLAIRGAGHVGDPHHVPWLIAQMEEPARARCAGESFALITGVDLARDGLHVPPEAREGVVDPAPGVAVDEDGLPWPDVGKVSAWWHIHGAAYHVGGRYFMGGPADAARCRAALLGGRQRQRRAAAEHLVIGAPGTALFDTEAPAWRQRRRLGGAA